MGNTKTSTNPINNNTRKDRSKIYFFVIAIAALLLTNAYFYIKFKSSGEKLYTVTLQKEDLQREIDRVEAELDNIKNSSLDGFPESLIIQETQAREIISDLRKQLDNVNVTELELEEAKLTVQSLKNQVIILQEESSELFMQNEMLKRENDSLNSKVLEKTTEVKELQEDNLALNNKISTASSIKVSNFTVNGVAKNKRDIYEVVVKARQVEELQIKFNVVENELAVRGSKDIYIRIIDPKGSLIANAANVFDLHDGNKLQYTFKEKINFTNNGEEYEFLWSNDSKYLKGAYTVLLYADGSIMGRSNVVFK